MAVSALEDKSRLPDDEALEAGLGRAAARWKALVKRVGERFGPITQEWKYPGAKYGWSLRLKRGERVLVYLIPGQKTFMVALVFGERAVQAIRASDVPGSVKTLVEEARPYAEGRGIRFEVARVADLDLVERLIEVKLG